MTRKHLASLALATALEQPRLVVDSGSAIGPLLWLNADDRLKQRGRVLDGVAEANGPHPLFRREATVDRHRVGVVQ